jgi:hypothetical protein
MYCCKKVTCIFLPWVQPWPSFEILVAESSKISNTCAVMILKRNKNLNQHHWYYKCFELLDRRNHVAISILHISKTSVIDRTLCSGHAFWKLVTEMNSWVLIWRWQFALEGSVSKLPSRNMGLCGDHNYLKVNVARNSGVKLIMTIYSKEKCEHVKH